MADKEKHSGRTKAVLADIPDATCRPCLTNLKSKISDEDGDKKIEVITTKMY